MAGGKEFDPPKFEELIVYIARRLGPEAALGRIKLAKLLMHSDFIAFRRLGRSITGATYEKWEHGHLPRELLMEQRDLEAAGDLEVESVSYFGKSLKHITAQRDPNMSGFTEDEIAIIEGALRLYGHESAAYLSHLAHQEPGWMLSEDHAVIPYETSLISTESPSDSDVEYFRRLHGLAA